MIDIIIILKLIVTIFFVILLSYLAEHVSPRLSGIIAGVPTGSAIILFFFGLENGADFASKSSIFNLAAMLCMHVFILMYFMASDSTSKLNILRASIASTIAYLAIAFILRQVYLNIWISVLIAACSIITFTIVFDRIKDSIISKPVKLGYYELLFRSSMAALFVILITGIAAVIGKEWSGLLSAFPTTLMPLILIIHHRYGHENVHTIIKNVPKGSWAMLIYMIGVYYLYPILGIYLGTIVCYSAVIFYLFLLSNNPIKNYGMKMKEYVKSRQEKQRITRAS